MTLLTVTLHIMTLLTMTLLIMITYNDNSNSNKTGDIAFNEITHN